MDSKYSFHDIVLAIAVSIARMLGAVFLCVTAPRVAATRELVACSCDLWNTKAITVTTAGWVEQHG
jgi:hypothetical protein